MVVKGSAELNICEVREIIETAVEIKDKLYSIVDRAQQVLEVDLNTGLIYRYKNGIRVLCNTVDTSEKENGYLYCKIHIQDDKDNIIEKQYAQHSIVAMLAHTEEYDRLFALYGKQLVANHKDNCPWNNHPDNLEWTITGLNTLHGKIVAGLYKHHSYINSMTHRAWTTIKHNQSDVDFVTLLIPISVDDVAAYEKYIESTTRYKTLRGFWHLGSDNLPTEYELLAFIRFLDNKRPTTERSVRNYNISTVITFDDVETKINTREQDTKISAIALELAILCGF